MSGTVGNNVGRGSGTIVAAAGGLASGTKTDFFQASAPTDWTQDATNNDKMLRVVSGSGGGTGGTAVISTPAHNLAAGAHTLSTAETASHSHTVGLRHQGSYGQPSGYNLQGPYASSTSSYGTSSVGSGSSHAHSTSGSITVPAYLDVIIATKD